MFCHRPDHNLDKYSSSGVDSDRYAIFLLGAATDTCNTIIERKDEQVTRDVGRGTLHEEEKGKFAHKKFILYSKSWHFVVGVREKSHRFSSGVSSCYFPSTSLNLWPVMRQLKNL
jgi:hypothetical protein